MNNEWFLELERIYSLLPDYESAYTHLGRLYAKVLDEATYDAEVHLAGTFAKTDYLLKEKSATPMLKRSVNDMRLRLTKNIEAQHSGTFNNDFQALCLFVSLIYNVPVPEELANKFPVSPVSSKPSRLEVEYIRVIVTSWDDETITCNSEYGDESLQVRYSGDGQLFDVDHSYLADLLESGLLLNIVRPHIGKNGELLPEFIILEPDFLVDVSTISSCFESYAESPLVSLLKRLEPQSSSEAILMGNMAGELLDRLLHEADAQDLSEQTLKKIYLESVQNFFRNNAVGIMTVLPGREFHTNSWQQMLNIRNALVNVLPGQLCRYDSDNIIVEPTFFSEMLGLLGRMDMLQADMRVLVEQKAGKAAFVPGATDYTTPTHKEQHYVQMLLYMAIIRYNYRHIYDENNQELHAFLLYSKYSHPLVGLGFAPKLLFRAIKVRNQYVAQEEIFSKGGADILMSLNADDINEKKVCGKFWAQFQRPRIEYMLANLQGASELEKAYFLRFYRFVSLEHRLSKLGSQTKENSGFASAWLSTLDEKEQCGNIMLNLTMQKPDVSEMFNIDSVVLQYAGECGSFRQGDIVVLYSYAKETKPDLRKTMVYRATVQEITPTTMVLRLRNPQKDASVFFHHTDMLWCIEHDFMESSYSGLYRGLYSFMCAPQERKDLVLMQRFPKTDTAMSIKGEYGSFTPLQQRIKEARELFLIIGPPGTGKTSFGMLNTLQEELLEKDSKVLIVSYTNRSVDEICDKLYPEIDFIRIGGLSGRADEYSENYLGDIVTRCTSVTTLKERFSQTRVIVGTTSSVTAHLPLIQMQRFSLCIVDEASQILEPHLLPLLSLCCSDGLPCITKFVMIGDHKQLPAVVQQRTRDSKVREPLLNAIGLEDCRNSLFERLLSRYRNNPAVCYMLTRQGRMHRDIAHFPNIAFYGGMLHEVPLDHQISSSPTSRIRFVDVVPYPDSLSDKVNLAEAQVIASELIRIWSESKNAFKPMETVGVIVPYRNQISAIRSVLAEMLGAPEHPLLQISIDTVERYQGSQRKYIIFGFTVQKHYQLRFLTETTFEEDGQVIDRKLNVAMTRAQEYLILVGNSALLSNVHLYSRLLRYIDSESKTEYLI